MASLLPYLLLPYLLLSYLLLSYLLLSYLLLFAAFAGHVALWTWLYNRLHASGIPSKLVHKLEKFVVLAMLGSMLVPAIWLLWLGRDWLTSGAGFAYLMGRLWVAVCGSMLVYVTLAWALRRFTVTDSGLLLDQETKILDMEAAVGFHPIGDRRTKWQSRIPGNQILEVHLERKTIAVRNLPPELDGLRIAQVTDLHMTGQLLREFFDVAIDHTNAWGADLVAVTGDLVDKAACIDWIPSTLGRLTSRYGVFALLGNHDQRLNDVQQLRHALVDCGIVDVGGRSLIHSVRGIDVLLAGNECPWFPPAPTVPDFDDAERPFSILLSHAPDPLPWARRHHFNLMLAGHTHGGQIRFPLVGPVVCPSRYGVRYASGLFDVAPVLLHVSRGLSGVHTLRFNCPPEITLLELHRLEV